MSASFWYKHKRVQEWIALAEHQKQTKKKGATRVEETPKPRDRDMTQCTYKYQAWKILQDPHQDMLVMVVQAGNPDDYHLALVPSECEYESDELEATDAEEDEEGAMKQTIHNRVIWLIEIGSI